MVPVKFLGTNILETILGHGKDYQCQIGTKLYQKIISSMYMTKKKHITLGKCAFKLIMRTLILSKKLSTQKFIEIIIQKKEPVQMPDTHMLMIIDGLGWAHISLPGSKSKIKL